METATIRLTAAERTDIVALALDLGWALNRPGEPEITVSVDGDTLMFECFTWDPVLESRVSDVMDALVGTGWHDAFEAIPSQRV